MNFSITKLFKVFRNFIKNNYLYSNHLVPSQILSKVTPKTITKLKLIQWSIWIKYSTSKHSSLARNKFKLLSLPQNILNSSRNFKNLNLKIMLKYFSVTFTATIPKPNFWKKNFKTKSWANKSSKAFNLDLFKAFLPKNIFKHFSTIIFISNIFSTHKSLVKSS